MLAQVCDEGRRRGAKAITARVVPTPKNVPARDVFEQHGFAKVREDDSGATLWRLDLETSGVGWPSWFKR
jgi:predicted enzyme involved in methoxymalonyl-ACP biosynthesis